MHIFSWFTRRKDPNENLWHKCSKCSELVYICEIEDNCWVCTWCDHHERLKARKRLELTFDQGSFEELDYKDSFDDPIKFKDYKAKLKKSRVETGQNDCYLIGFGNIKCNPAVVLAVDFSFIGGSMGKALGNAIVYASEQAVSKRAPLIIFSSSGGARMQEGMFSLLQMARTTIAVNNVKLAALPFISVMCDPTTGGVQASYASLGTVVLAEPKALIGFAGPRVIKQTINTELPEGFQSSEFQFKNGFIDKIVNRKDMRKELGRILTILR
ncbi:MAG: acetyl-CoA carboxylase, carboxyltransferase subunit beta [Alphaproteobacteria bacterium]|nr:MAG: acetyl-CoA carboxylase, carboxyltransferase subunit beta [Alphaproteobacteria bacterium]